MKKIIFIMIPTLLVSLSYSQPVGAPPSPNNVANDAVSAWYRGGNFPVGATPVTSNVFGTAAGFNSGIYTMTFGINRTRLNGSQTATLNGVVQPVDGYFGIGPNGYFASNSPATMLHLQGPDNSGFGSLSGWRKWIKTGTFTSENSDALAGAMCLFQKC